MTADSLAANAMRFVWLMALELKRPTIRRLRVIVYVTDREQGGRVIAASGVLVDHGLGSGVFCGRCETIYFDSADSAGAEADWLAAIWSAI